MSEQHKNHFVLMGGAADFGELAGSRILTGEPDEEIVWTVLKTARAGDQAFIYVTAPVSAIVASATIKEDAWLQESLLSDWNGYWMAELSDVRIFAEEKLISIKLLRLLFPDWKWLGRPQSNVRVPDTVLEPFLQLIKETE